MKKIINIILLLTLVASICGIIFIVKPFSKNNNNKNNTKTPTEYNSSNTTFNEEQGLYYDESGNVVGYKNNVIKLENLSKEEKDEIISNLDVEQMEYFISNLPTIFDIHNIDNTSYDYNLDISNMSEKEFFDLAIQTLRNKIALKDENYISFNGAGYLCGYIKDYGNVIGNRTSGFINIENKLAFDLNGGYSVSRGDLVKIPLGRYQTEHYYYDTSHFYNDHCNETKRGVAGQSEKDICYGVTDIPSIFIDYQENNYINVIDGIIYSIENTANRKSIKKNKPITISYTSNIRHRNYVLTSGYIYELGYIDRNIETDFKTYWKIGNAVFYFGDWANAIYYWQLDDGNQHLIDVGIFYLPKYVEGSIYYVDDFDSFLEYRKDDNFEFKRRKEPAYSKMRYGLTGDYSGISKTEREAIEEFYVVKKADEYGIYTTGNNISIDYFDIIKNPK